MKFPDFRLLVFARAPIPGRVKTRLIPSLGPSGAAELYALMARKCIQTAVDAALCPVELWCSPGTDDVFFEEVSSSTGVPLFAQSGDDLGQRMCGALDSALQRGSHALIIGSDCVSLDANDLQAAMGGLAGGADVVLGPSEDGGYYLIGLACLWADLFKGIVWGQADVCELTRQRIGSLGLNCAELAVRWDVDRPEDLERLRESGILELPAELAPGF